MAMEAISNNYNSIKPLTQNSQTPDRVVAFPSEGEGDNGNNEVKSNVPNPKNLGAEYIPNEAPKASTESAAVSKTAEDNEEYIKQETERIKNAVSEMNKKMINTSEAVFGIHEDTNRVTIKIVDKETKKVIKELPPEKTLDMIAKAWELAGLLVDERR